MPLVKNFLTFDVEEWFTAPLLATVPKSGVDVPAASGQTRKILDILNKFGVKSTFFVVGQVAQNDLELVKEIREGGHEVACHTFDHASLFGKTILEFKRDLARCRKVLGKCKGFRAPMFSIGKANAWVFEELSKMGFDYDSSVFPCWTPEYDFRGAPTKPYRISPENIFREDAQSGFFEFPVLTLDAAGLQFPIGGGFYFRMAPFFAIDHAIRRQNSKSLPATIYIHPWELDCLPKIASAGVYRNFVMRGKIGNTEKKLEKLCKKYRFSTIEEYTEAF